MKFISKRISSNDTRQKWVISQLNDLPPGIKILDAGAGECFFKTYCSHLNYVSQDFGQYDGEGDSIGLHTGTWNNTQIDITSDITNIPVKGCSFDAILCTEVLEHVPNAVAVLKEFSRILRPGGVLIMTAPFSSVTHFAPYHFSGYSRYWYEHHLPSFGFDIEHIEASGNWFSFMIQEMRRSRHVGELYASGLLGLLGRISVIPAIIMFGIIERCDRGSEQLLCFNFYTRSKKRDNVADRADKTKTKS